MWAGGNGSNMRPHFCNLPVTKAMSAQSSTQRHTYCSLVRASTAACA